LPVNDEADVGAVRRVVARYADELGASDAGRGRAQLVATELATNLVRHAKPGGWLLARPVPPAGIELLAVDHGPGIADLAAALDGRTPEPSGLGRGLAGVRRACARFDVHTERERGSAVLALIDLGGSAPPRSWGGVSVGVTEVCGDGWAVLEADGGLTVAVVDGLGHGRAASLASDAALDALAADPLDLAGFLVRANDAMRTTRGAAAAVCRLDPARGELRYVVVGNVSGCVVTGTGEQRLTFTPGTLGISAAPPRGRVLGCPWPPGAALVLWTDGLASRLGLPAEPALLTHDPAVVAAALHRDHSRERDDATVVVVRNLDAP